jgi:hypothetical protein
MSTPLRQHIFVAVSFSSSEHRVELHALSNPSAPPDLFAAMLYIHRSFFAQALLDFPTNPLRSPYAPSFLAAYRCASATIKTTILNFQMYPALYMRWWPIWSHLLSAAVCSGLGA